MTDEFLHAHRLRQLLFALVLVLTFEGVARKVAPPGLGVPLFLLKDTLVLVIGFFVLKMPRSPAIGSLWNAYKILPFFFVPPFLLTFWHDPLLAVFGAKQYLLYPMVGFATFYAFQRTKVEDILRYFRWISLLVIPTSLLALLELHLPHDHWLNQTVTGDSLEAFQAAGELRVSSSFSFVAQFCFFLNAQTFIIMIALRDWGLRNFIWKTALLLLIPFFVLSNYITGSRGAVTVNLAIMLLAVALTAFKFKLRNILLIVFIIGGLYLTALAVNYVSPDSTAAFSERENGRMIGFSSEIMGRLYNSFFSIARDPYLRTPFGNGLGIMSNGSDTFSTYADFWRTRAAWTETDFSTTLFEGGYYLAFVWYGFRIYVIVATTHRFLAGVTETGVISAAFTQAFVVMIGVFGTLAIQPPMAIWWWLGVGTTLIFWWKSIAPPESEEPAGPAQPPQPKQARGRSLYSESLHSRK